MSQFVWASVDPVRRKVDIYPKTIALRIEKSYNELDVFGRSPCVLGSDFFNATVPFSPSGTHFRQLLVSHSVEQDLNNQDLEVLNGV